MDRVITNVGESVYEWLFSKPDQNTMVGLAKLSAAMLGASTVVNGLSCVPTGPASMQVVVNPGEIYSLVSLEASVCGTLPADSAHQIVKQGVILDAYTSASGALAAPSTAGQSIAYLIEAQYADSDISIDPTTGNTPVVLQFYNSSNPQTPYSGPGGGGATSTTFRKGIVSLQIKAGAAATTGSQVTPTPDAGWVGLWVVTVANGQSTITAGNITQYAGAPILPSSLLASIQNGNLSYAVATGTANAHTIALTPALTSRVDGMMLRYKAPAANTGAVTLADGVGTANVLGANHSALQGGEYIANGDAIVVWNSSISGGSYILVECTGGALQVAPATQSQHAPQMGQLTGVIGSRTNLKASCLANATSITFTADQIIVGSALNGLQYALPSFNKTLNLATTGAGGMDTGTATAGSWLAVYAIYNPTSGTSALLGTIEGGSAAPTIYGGANMPSGYAASALLVVLPVSSTTGQLKACLVNGRRINVPTLLTFQTSTATGTPTSFSLSGAVPKTAVRVSGTIVVTSTSTSNVGMNITADSASALGYQNVSQSGGASGTGDFAIDMLTPQTLFYQAQNSAGTPTYSLSVSAYEV